MTLPFHRSDGRHDFSDTATRLTFDKAKSGVGAYLEITHTEFSTGREKEENIVISSRFWGMGCESL